MKGRPRCLGLGPTLSICWVSRKHTLSQESPPSGPTFRMPRHKSPGDEGLVWPIQQCSGSSASPWRCPSCTPPARCGPHGHSPSVVGNEGVGDGERGLLRSQSVVALGEGQVCVLIPSPVLNTLPHTLLLDPRPQQSVSCQSLWRCLETYNSDMSAELSFPFDQ